ncbi:hypothetical protein CR513_36035, partial [Mucuna pruriens]
MNNPLMKQILEMVEAEQASKGLSNNYGTSGSFNNYGSGPKSESKMTSPLMKKILAMIEAEEAAGKGSSNNYGTSGSFNNHGGAQDFKNAMINSGQNAGNRNRYHTSNHHGERTVNNSGNFHGNGNGGFVEDELALLIKYDCMNKHSNIHDAN